MAILKTQKRTRAKLTSTQKAERHQKLANLTNAIETARDAYQEEARGISQDYGRSLKWTRAQLSGGRLTRQRRKASSWNAFMSIKLSEANETRGPGERYRLPAFIAANHAKLHHEYSRLPEAEKKKLRLGIDELRATRVNIVRSNPKALIKDVNSTFSTMEKEWLAIHARTSVEGFYIAVRGDLEHYHEAKIFLTAKAKSFIKDVLHFEPKHLALKFESWAVGNFESSARATNRLPLSRLVSLCRKNIQDGLDNILQKHHHHLKSRKVLMNYDNYEKKIVEVYAVAIKGWTYEKNICNPGKIGRRECLITLLDALVSDKCHWDVLTEEELSDRISDNHKRQANGEKIYKPRKARQPRATNSAKSAQTVCDTDSEDEGQDNAQDNAQDNMQDIEQDNEQENTGDMDGVEETPSTAGVGTAGTTSESVGSV